MFAHLRKALFFFHLSSCRITVLSIRLSSCSFLSVGTNYPSCRPQHAGHDLDTLLNDSQKWEIDSSGVISKGEHLVTVHDTIPGDKRHNYP